MNLQQHSSALKKHLGVLACTVSALLAGCGGGGPGDGDPVDLGQAQSITFSAAPTLVAGGTATVQATATSGLAVTYGSSTPTICSVGASTGLVSGLAAGSCVITANQAGDATWASAAQVTQTIQVTGDQVQTITFGSAPTLAVHDLASVQATASSGLAVSYSSLTTATCSVQSGSGLITALASGTCTVAANQAGNASYAAATQVTQTVTISAAAGSAAPGTPQGVSVTAGSTLGSASVTASSVQANGSAITTYTVTSTPSGITASSSSLPVTVTCASGSCAGYAFSLAASNASGSSAASAAADLLVAYDVVLVFNEPSYVNDKTEFHGSFVFNASQRTVSGLQGDLSEVMAGNDQPNQTWPSAMPLLHLTHQLVSQSATGGLLVGTFLLDSTQTLSTDARDGGVANGWQPGTGSYKYDGYAHGDYLSANPGNAYALIYVNTTDPTTSLSAAQVNLLAYADCAEQGMMGDDCMTGTTVSGYGVIGSMGGYPVSQTITRRSVP